MSYQQLCNDYKFDEKRLTRIKSLFEVCTPTGLRDSYEQMKVGEFFVCEGGGLPFGCTYWLTAIRVKDKLYVYQSEMIAVVTTEDVKIISFPTEEDWKAVVSDIGYDNLDLSQYDYLEVVIDEFWKRVFGKTTSEMWCGGIIGAHGDKAYGYKREWSDAGIPFNRGVLLFLLTYTKELGETPKHESCQWVIDNYPKYLPHIEAAEKLAGLV